MATLKYQVREDNRVRPGSLTITGCTSRESILQEAVRLAKELSHADSHPRNFEVYLETGERVQI